MDLQIHANEDEGYGDDLEEDQDNLNWLLHRMNELNDLTEESVRQCKLFMLDLGVFLVCVYFILFK